MLLLPVRAGEDRPRELDSDFVHLGANAACAAWSRQCWPGQGGSTAAPLPRTPIPRYRKTHRNSGPILAHGATISPWHSQGPKPQVLPMLSGTAEAVP
jgi:hypothetical protein